MSFDATILDTTIEELQSKMIELNGKKDEINLVTNSLLSIQDQKYLVIEEDGRRVYETKPPQDLELGGDVDSARKEEIFNVNIQKATELLI